MHIGLDLDDTIIDTEEKLRIYWKDYYKKYPNKDYSEELPHNINLFGYKYIEEFWNIYREELFYADIKKDAARIIRKLQNEGHYIGLITSRPKEKYKDLVLRIDTYLKENNIFLDEINTDIVYKDQFIIDKNYDLLIDDNIVNIKNTIKKGKKGILFKKINDKTIRHTTSWNYLYIIIKEYQ